MMSNDFKFPYKQPIFDGDPGGTSGDDFLMLCSPAGRIIFMSGSLRLYIGEDLAGRNLNDFVEDELAAKIIAVARSGESYDFSCSVCHHSFNCTAEAGGDKIKIWFYPSAAEAKNGMPVSSARFVSSEINNSLNMLFASVSALSDSIGEDEAYSSSLAMINQNLYRLLRLSRNMADCTGAGNGMRRLRPSEEDAAALCRELLERASLLMGKCGISMEVSIPEHPVPCRIDREIFSRVLLNLLSNAILSGGRSKRITVSLSESESELFLTVTDTGNGIPSETLAELFRQPGEAQETAPPLSSSGFGLPLVKHFCELHGGRIMIMSQEQSGTSVRASFARYIDEPELTLRGVTPELVGHDLVLLELSSALDKEAFMR